MAEPQERRSNRSRKPKIHFDNQITQSSRPSNPSIASKASGKPTNPTTKPTQKPLPPAAKFNEKPSKSSTNLPILDPVEDLCS